MNKSDFVQFFETTAFVGDDRTPFRFLTFPVDDLSDITKVLFKESNAKIWHPDTYPLIDESFTRGLVWSDQDPENRIANQMDLLPYVVAAIAAYPEGSLETIPDKLKLQRFTDLFAPCLYDDAIDLNLPNEEQVSTLLDSTAPYLALVRNGRYESMLKREDGERLILRELFRQSQKRNSGKEV